LDKIIIKHGDILNHKDECLVNAANEQLLGGGGIDGIVH
jgi:O-acetyl-ADP-ribose deacetylase (regulator of RNase III)